MGAIFIARQPIFNRKLDVYGYELLYRMDSQAEEFGGASSQSATAAVLSGLFESGISQVVDNKQAFINFDEHFIHSDALELIPPDKLVVELLEDIKVDWKLMRRIEELKEKGYKIALDDFVEDYDQYPLIELARIIKFDLMETPLKEIETDVKRALADRKIILAEKVETKWEFLQAKEMGFHLFQGYFFSKPSIINKSNIKTSSRTQYLRILWELKKPEPSYDILARIIEQDVGIAYRFMRVVSHRTEENLIYSIKKGLTYMGLDEIERWISILMLHDIGQEKPEELTKLSLIRTKFAEEISLHGRHRRMKHEASMMGLFSTLDAMLDEPMEKALKDLALTNSIKQALIEHKGELYPVYRLLLAYEHGEWKEVNDIARSEKIDLNILGREYLGAIKWANQTMVKMA